MKNGKKYFVKSLLYFNFYLRVFKYFFPMISEVPCNRILKFMTVM